MKAKERRKIERLAERARKESGLSNIRDLIRKSPELQQAILDAAEQASEKGGERNGESARNHDC